jgi:hypothetical protein
MRRKLHISAALAIPLLAAGTTAASAAGPPIEPTTVHLDNEVSVVQGVHPCTGQAALITVVESGVIHLIIKADGTVHFTGTLRGTISADAEPADGVLDATGRFVSTFGGSGLLLEDSGTTGRAVTGFTENGSGTNADGTKFRWHENGRTVFDGTGTPRLDRFHQTANCS